MIKIRNILLLIMISAISLNISGATKNVLTGKKTDKYIMVTFSSGIEYWKNSFRGMKDAAENLNVTAEYTGANEYDINQQVTVLEQVIAKKPKAILLTCINPNAMKAPIQKAIKAGIPVITFDADSPNSGRTAFLATSNYSAGVIVAHQMAKLTNGKGKIGVITLLGQLNHEERTKGFIDTIMKEYPFMKVVSIQDGKADQIITAQVASAMIQSNRDLAGIFTTEANGGVGAATAVREAGAAGKIKIISFDTDKGTLDAIKNGEISATLAQGTYNMGYWGMLFAYHAANNIVSPTKGDWKSAKVAPLPTYVDTGVNIVTKENVQYFYK